MMHPEKDILTIDVIEGTLTTDPGGAGTRRVVMSNMFALANPIGRRKRSLSPGRADQPGDQGASQ
jgi:hypothetical protein